MKFVPLICLLTVFTGTALSAEKEEGWNPDTKFPPLAPAEAIKTIEIPKGYRLECVASEPMVEEPASFAFDGNGALYVCEWRTYMQDEFATKQLDPVSRVVKLVDTNGDGIVNMLEFFLARDPLAQNPPSSLPIVTRNGTTLDYTYTRSLSAMSQLSYAVEWSDTLATGSWSSAGVTEQILSDNGTVQHVKASVPAGSNSRRFLRLEVQ